MNAASDYRSYEDRAAEKLASTLTTTLRAKASASGWPKEVVSSLDVVYEDKTVRIDYPSSLEDKIDELEYGNFAHPPTPVIRPFQTAISDDVYNAFQDAICGFLFDNEVLA